MDNSFKFNPYEALKSILEITSYHTGDEFIEHTAIEIKKLFQADLVYITKAIDFNPTTKVKILYSTNDKVPNIIDLNGIPGKFVFDIKFNIFFIVFITFFKMNYFIHQCFWNILSSMYSVSTFIHF